MLSVVQLVNELILHGIDARIATLSVDPGVREWTWLLTEPMVFRSPAALMRNLPPTDIAVATNWPTASWVKTLIDNNKARVSAYFIQDFAAWMTPETDNNTRQRILDEYGLIPNRIVMSDWLAAELAKHGYETHKILWGLDLDVLYPRTRYPAPPTILTLARPRASRRGFTTVIEALVEVKRQTPNVRIVFFGADDLALNDIPFAFEYVGKIADQNQLAQLYSDADLFLETSTWQGFGRYALEAMVCGTAVVLTPIGDAMEYARPDINCLAVPPDAPSEAAAAVLRVLDDDHLKQRLAAAGTETARHFCHRREATETAQYFTTLIAEWKHR